MPRYAFSHAERYAVFTTHHERCWLCEQPVTLSEMQVDHIIPESLIGADALPDVLRTLGRADDFDLNSYANWLPAHPVCNRRKSGMVLEPTPLIQARLQDALAKAPRAQELADRYASNRQVEGAIQQLLIAKDKGSLTERHQTQLQEILINFHEESRAAEDKGKPLQLAPWLTVVHESAHYFHVQGPAGVGIRPKAERLDPSWDCPRCGPTGWNGARCVTCGMMDDGD